MIPTSLSGNACRETEGLIEAAESIGSLKYNPRFLADISFKS
jgi:hypothetical protein